MKYYNNLYSLGMVAECIEEIIALTNKTANCRINVKAVIVANLHSEEMEVKLDVVSSEELIVVAKCLCDYRPALAELVKDDELFGENFWRFNSGISYLEEVLDFIEKDPENDDFDDWL